VFLIPFPSFFFLSADEGLLKCGAKMTFKYDLEENARSESSVTVIYPLSGHDTRKRPMAKQLPEKDTPSPKEDVGGLPFEAAPFRIV